MIATILAVGRTLQHWRTLVRVACVVAIALGSISHLVADFASVDPGPISVVAVPSDAGGSCGSATVVERCHSCCVVSFLTVAASSREEIVARAVPDGRMLHLLAFMQPIAAPPPRTLT